MDFVNNKTVQGYSVAVLDYSGKFLFFDKKNSSNIYDLKNSGFTRKTIFDIMIPLSKM